MAHEKSVDDQRLKLARTAAGIPSLARTKITLENGILTGLDLSKQGLISLPESIGQLTSLTSLNLDGNPLASLPESIGQLTKLTELNLCNNQLASLPESIGQLTKLTKLILNNNNLATPPESIGQLASLTRLDLRDNQLASLPQSIEQLTSLTILDLENNRLVSLPKSIGQFTKLTWLFLSSNQLFSLPESIGQLTMLTELNLCNNELAFLPDSIGQLTMLTELNLCKNELAFMLPSIGQLTKLTSLELSDNQLASVPESIGRLTSLTSLGLSSNMLSGDVPLWLGNLVHLNSLDLSNNPDLGGSLPALSCLNIRYEGTNISGVHIKVKPVENLVDRLFVVTHVLLGYVDLVTDVLSIMQFHKQGNTNLMAANVVFLFFNVCVDVFLMPDAWGKVLALLQVQQAVQAYESLESGRQTENFVRSKKVDAVCRSAPSIVLQLYGLLATLPSPRSSEGVILVLSVVTGFVGSSISLGSLAPKSGLRFFSPSFVVHFCYYVCELTARLLSMSLLFVSIGPIAFAVLGVDFLVRLILYCFVESGDMGSKVLSAVLLFGSDGVNGFDLRSLVAYSSISSGILLISLFLVNLVDTPELRALRAARGGPVQAVTALACGALCFKYLVGWYIIGMEAQSSYLQVEKADKDGKEGKEGREGKVLEMSDIVIAEEAGGRGGGR